MTQALTHRLRRTWLRTWLRTCLAGVLLLALLPLCAHTEPPAQPQAQTTTIVVAANPTPSTLSPTEYRARLQSLDQLLANCQRETTPANCDSSKVGPDVQIALPTGARQAHFGWLRALLDQAAKHQAELEKAAKSKPEKKPPTPRTAIQFDFPPPTLAQRLEEARKRLADQNRQLAQQISKPASQPNAQTQSATPQRQTLTAILAAKEYKSAVVGPSIKQQIYEKIANWLNRVIARIVEAGSKSKWIGIAAEVVFGALVLGALIWFLIRLERQGRHSRYDAIQAGPGAGAASARDWQLWLADAHNAANRGAWRDAIHLTYWASISRLESSGLWPADRARTPREYLALLAQESTHRPDLTTLTRSFERTWYANRRAAEADFLEAQQLATKLGVASSETHRRRPR